MDFPLVTTEEGVLLPVSAHPAARKNGIAGVHDGRLKVMCTQAPEKGKANKALIQVLAAELRLKRSQIRLHAGETAAKKVFLIGGIDAADLQQRIRELVNLQD